MKEPITDETSYILSVLIDAVAAEIKDLEINGLNTWAKSHGANSVKLMKELKQLHKILEDKSIPF